MSDPRLVVVRWNDASSSATKVFTEKDHAPVVMHTIGWLRFQDDAGISLCCECFHEEGEWQWRGHTFIPAGMVIDVRELL